MEKLLLNYYYDRIVFFLAIYSAQLIYSSVELHLVNSPYFKIIVFNVTLILSV